MLKPGLLTKLRGLAALTLLAGAAGAFTLEHEEWRPYTGAAFVALTGAALVLLRRLSVSLTAPVKLMREALSRLSKGDLETPAPVVKGSDEFGHLSVHFAEFVA